MPINSSTGGKGGNMETVTEVTHSPTANEAWEYIFGKKQYHGENWESFIESCWRVVDRYKIVRTQEALLSIAKRVLADEEIVPMSELKHVIDMAEVRP